MGEPDPVRVLVVDDNAENRMLIQAMLGDGGYEVALAASGEDALAAFASGGWDCVLLDIRMPVMDGIEVCRRIRALPGGVDVPILFLTALRDVDTFDRARDAGGDDFLTRPFRVDELISRLGVALKLRRTAQERRELFEQVRTQRDDLMRLQLQREQLLAFLVHDLKNPVNAIALHGQRIARDPGATDRARDAAARIESEVRSLLRMIMNLLDVSRADEGRLLPMRRRLLLRELVDDVVLVMRPRAQEYGIALAADGCGAEVSADPDLLHRTLENLVDNALRYAPDGSVVRVTAAPCAGGVELRVADAGPGVPEEQRARVFERFVRADAEQARTNRGLGLAFCKLAVEAHGGRIWIEEAKPGAIFCIMLPHG